MALVCLRYARSSASATPPRTSAGCTSGLDTDVRVERAAARLASSQEQQHAAPEGRVARVAPDTRRPRWNDGAMNKNRKRRALDLFVEALVHPVRLR